MKSGISFLIICLSLLMFRLPQCLAQSVQNRTTYCEDGGPGVFELDADSLPKAVVKSVMNTPESKQELSYSDETETSSNPEKLLRAAKISLSSDGATEFLILGSPPLSGADNSWFWIVLEDEAKTSVLLWTGGNCVELEGSKTRGYRDVESYWAGGGDEQIDTYQYDGKAYKLVHTQTRPLGPSD